MKTKFILSLLMMGMLHFSYAQNLVSNVNWQLDDSEEKIIITYDLEKDGSYRYLDVGVKVYIDDNELLPKALVGDVGTYVRAGKEKTILWDVFKDVVELSGELSIEVIAISPKTETTDPNNDVPATPKVKVNKVPIYAGLGGIITIGGGLIVGGVSQISNSNELYEVYELNPNPTDPVYDELSRQEHYDEANSKNKSGSWMAYGGAAVIVTGGIILIKRFIELKRWEKMGQVSIEPHIKLDSYQLTENEIPKTSVNLSFTYKF